MQRFHTTCRSEMRPEMVYERVESAGAGVVRCLLTAQVGDVAQTGCGKVAVSHTIAGPYQPFEHNGRGITARWERVADEEGFGNC